MAARARLVALVALDGRFLRRSYVEMMFPMQPIKRS